MTIRLTKSLPEPKQPPLFTFTSQMGIVTPARLLAEHRGHHSAEDRFHSLIYGLLIYDHYAQTFADANGLPPRIGQAWTALANEPSMAQLYQMILPWFDEGRIEDIPLDLPIPSASPLFTGSAPAGIAPGTYQLQNLSCRQFIEIAWKVRCNLLHGFWNPTDKNVWKVLRNVARPISALSWQMVVYTPR